MGVFILSRGRFKDLLAQYFAIKPSDVHGLDNTSAIFWRGQLLQKIFGSVIFEGVPEGWDIDYMKSALFESGVLCITDTALGVIPLECGTTGINVFKRPTKCVITNHILGELIKTIGIDCALVKIKYSYSGVCDLLDRYSYLLASCDSAISVNLMNTKVSYVFEAEDSAQAKTFEKVYDQISEGKPAIYTRKSTAIGSNMFMLKPKESFIADDVEYLRRRIMNDFLTEVGINNANTDKKERLLTNEVESNNDEVKSTIEYWIDNINSGFAVANRLYDLDLYAKARFIKDGNKNEPV